ncbi:MAG: nitroreductase [Clostridiales bacterium]|nr:nitroreductase [Clostridiales bacterium]
MNETLEVLETRRSCRKFKPDMIPDEDIEAIVRAGTYSATGMGKQSPIIIAVTNKIIRDEIADENRKIGGWQEGFDPFYGAPVILIVLAKKDVATHVYDGSLVMGNLMNAAHSLGIAKIWIHRAKEEFESEFGKKILDKLGITDEYEGIGHCALGYADGPVNDAAPRKDNYVYYL